MDLKVKERFQRQVFTQEYLQHKIIVSLYQNTSQAELLKKTTVVLYN
jgi:hypothetical protein